MAGLSNKIAALKDALDPRKHWVRINPQNLRSGTSFAELATW
jgi:hypothetical protein